MKRTSISLDVLPAEDKYGKRIITPYFQRSLRKGGRMTSL
jgi:hypothetical protein